MTDAADLAVSLTRRRTVTHYVQDILREVRGQATMMEARQALQDALNLIDGAANWEFLIATRLINTHAAVTSGTVSVNSGTTTVTLSGATWPVALSPYGEYREIKFADRSLPYKVASGTSSTVLELATALSGTSSNHIVDGNFVLYQARFPLPVDCEPGRDLALRGPVTHGNGGAIPKRERLIWERNTAPDMASSGIPQYYTDDEYDEANHSGTIRLEPYPTTAYELKLTYYKKLVIPDATDSIVNIPEAYERAPLLVAASNILRKKNMPGWQVMREEAKDMLNKMYNRYASSPAYEGQINPDLSDLMGGTESDIFGMDSLMFTRGGA